jgi:hypothetical protein
MSNSILNSVDLIANALNQSSKLTDYVIAATCYRSTTTDELIIRVYNTVSCSLVEIPIDYRLLAGSPCKFMPIIHDAINKSYQSTNTKLARYLRGET